MPCIVLIIAKVTFTIFITNSSFLMYLFSIHIYTLLVENRCISNIDTGCKAWYNTLPYMGEWYAIDDGFEVGSATTQDL